VRPCPARLLSGLPTTVSTGARCSDLIGRRSDGNQSAQLRAERPADAAATHSAAPTLG
jgi:hypothetical protein